MCNTSAEKLYQKWIEFHELTRANNLETYDESHLDCMKYMMLALFESQSAELQAFLLRTSFLKCFTGALCDEVVKRDDSTAVLAQISTLRIFLVSLPGYAHSGTGDDDWYCYHALAARFLLAEAKERLGEGHLRSLSQRACKWYEQHEMVTEAIEAALFAQAWEYAAVLIEQYLKPSPHFFRNDHRLLQCWLEQLPVDVLRIHPGLCLVLAQSLLDMLGMDPTITRRIQISLEVAELYWRKEEKCSRLGEVLTMRSLVAMHEGDLLQAFSAATQALEWLAQDKVEWRGINLLSTGKEKLLVGTPEAAQRMAQEAQRLFLFSKSTCGLLAATRLLGNVCHQQGELLQAMRYYQQVVDEATGFEKEQALLDLAALSYEWNNLDRAEQYLAITLGEKQEKIALTIKRSILLARVQYARGKTDQAQCSLQALLPLIQRDPGYILIYREVCAWRARFFLTNGDVTAAEQWTLHYPVEGKNVLLVQQKMEALVLARLLIAQGNATVALFLMGGWQTSMHAQGRKLDELEIIILMAQAYLSINRLVQARQTLLQALTMASGQRYQRIFLDEGQNVEILLQDLFSEVKEEGLKSYIYMLLQAFAQEQKEPVILPSLSLNNTRLISPQEQRVLGLLIAGHSYHEMSQKLFVSVNTIKTQIKSIYRKLNVNGRKEAIQKAKEIELCFVSNET